jgi:protein O-GlcNAc transferase
VTFTVKNKLIYILLLLSFIIAVPAQAKKKAEKPPERAIMHNNKGVTALYNGQIDRAIFEFKTASELAPKYVESWSNLGIAFKAKGRLDDAERVLIFAISLDKKFATPYNHLGTVYFAKKDYKGALRQYDLAIKYNSKFSDAQYNAALVYLALYQGDKNKSHLDKAVDRFRSATRINSEHPYAHHELAKVYQAQGKIEEAIIRFKLALEINSQLSDAWNSLATLYTQTGQTLKAKEALNRSLSTDPDSADAHLTFGLNYLKDNNFKMAINEFNKVIKTNPTNEIAYFHIGRSFYKYALRLKEEGRHSLAGQALVESNRAYQSAFKLKPTFDKAAYSIGYNYHQMHQYQKAAEWYQKCIDANADFSRAYFSLGIAHKAAGDSTKAAKAFCEFVKLKPKELADDISTAQSMIKSLGGCPK